MSEFKNLPSGWKVVRLGDVFDFLKSYTNSRESLNDYDDISYIHYGEIHKKYKFYLDFQVASLPKIHQSKLGDKPEFIKNGDLVVVDASEDYIDIAKSVEIKNLEHKAVAGLHTFLLRDKGGYFVDGFKGYILYEACVAKELKKKATGISVLGISKSNLLNLKIPIPPLDEQEKIAEILSTWDEAINLTINLIENKKQFKKALMQNLLTAKIRFPQFKDEWKETKLGEICDISAGTSKSRFIGDGKFYIVDMGSITQDGLLNLTKTTNLSQDFLDFGDLVMPKDDIGGGKIIGKVAVIDKDNTYVLSDHIFRIKTTENSNFLAYLINSDLINKKIRREVSGTAQLGLSKRTIENLKIKLPNLKEQQKIAEVLTACDDEINLLNLKLENLKRQKQGLMQKLLSAKVRTK